MLLLVLVSYSRESYRKPIAVITVLYFCGYLPYMGVYDLFGGFAINNSDSPYAISKGMTFVSYTSIDIQTGDNSYLLAMMIFFFILLGLEIAVLAIMGWHLWLRVKYYRRQH